jgi:hypothetical protein
MPVTLTRDCTSDMLYGHLKELGADVRKLKRKNPSFVELERMYYELLDARLASRSRRVSRDRYGTIRKSLK